MQQVTIGTMVFNSYSEYETAYIAKWQQIHGIYSLVDLNWVRKDWEMRISKPELYK
jgi:hypothetical protein